jgi:CPA1 family monovalent cation:H+ antiporter
LVHDAQGELIHPRLYEQYRYRAELMQRIRAMDSYPRDAITAHYTIVLTAIAAARTELLKMHRDGLVHDEMLHVIERDLDYQEVSAQDAMV